MRWQGIGHTDPLPAKDQKPHRSREGVSKAHPRTTRVLAGRLHRLRPGRRPVGIRQGGCLLHERAFPLELFPPLGYLPPLTAFSSPDRLFLPWPSFPSFFFRIWVLVCVALCKLGAHHAISRFGSRAIGDCCHFGPYSLLGHGGSSHRALSCCSFGN